jgi:hypothetical protein
MGWDVGLSGLGKILAIACGSVWNAANSISDPTNSATKGARRKSATSEGESAKRIVVPPVPGADASE